MRARGHAPVCPEALQPPVQVGGAHPVEPGGANRRTTTGREGTWTHPPVAAEAPAEETTAATEEATAPAETTDNTATAEGE